MGTESCGDLVGRDPDLLAGARIVDINPALYAVERLETGNRDISLAPGDELVDQGRCLGRHIGLRGDCSME